jgi:hypothetical protein
MFAVVMRFAVLIGVLTAIYVGLDWYMRRDRIRRLNEEHASGEGSALTREDYVTRGMAEYDRSWERKLLLGVYILPFLAALILALVANYG